VCLSVYPSACVHLSVNLYICPSVCLSFCVCPSLCVVSYFLGLWGLCDHERIEYDHETRGTQHQEWLCWRGPATIYPIRPYPTSLSVCVSPLIFVRRLMRSLSYLWVCAFLLNCFFFYAVRVVSKESRLFIRHRTSSSFIISTLCGSFSNKPSPANEA
jgi:hypothetical protein